MSSSWSSRIGSWASSASGRFSPFGHPSQESTGSHQVTDSDFSYITSDDLETHRASQQTSDTSQPRRRSSRSPPSTRRPARDTDVLTFKHKKTTHAVHFPSYTIDDGILTLSAARAAAARKLDVHDPRRVRLFHAGRKLADDRALCRDVGLRSAAANEILVVPGEPLDSDSDASSSDGDATGADARDGPDSPGPAAAGGKRRKRKPRKKKSASARAKAASSLSSGSGASTPTVEHLPIPAGLHPSHRAASSANPSPSPRAHSPNPTPAAVPQTPRAKLEAIATVLHGTLAPQAEALMAGAPPFQDAKTDRTKRDFEYKRVSETILAQVVLKLDGVETEGDEEARRRRRELVRVSQGILGRLDEYVKGG